MWRGGKMYIYTNQLGKIYNLYWSEVKLKNRKRAKVFFLLPEDKRPSNTLYKAYLAADLPKTMEIKEIGVNHTPLVYKVRNGEDE